MRNLLARSGEEVFLSTFSLYKISKVIAIAIKNTFSNSVKVVECKENSSLNQTLAFVKKEERWTSPRIKAILRT